MIPFLFLLFLIVFVIISVIWNKSKSEEKFTQRESYTSPTQSRTSSTGATYKKVSFREFEIRGMHFRNLPPTLKQGAQDGYLKTENNQHDKYAVGVFLEDDTHIGYIPKGNYRLSNTLNEKYYGRHEANVIIRYYEESSNWWGKVEIQI